MSAPIGFRGRVPRSVSMPSLGAVSADSARLFFYAAASSSSSSSNLPTLLYLSHRLHVTTYQFYGIMAPKWTLPPTLCNGAPEATRVDDVALIVPGIMSYHNDHLTQEITNDPEETMPWQMKKLCRSTNHIKQSSTQ